MANIIDYLDWRGDMTLRESPFNEVDNLILSNLSYGRFQGIVPGLEGESCPLPEAAAAHAKKGPFDVVKFDALAEENLPRLLEKMAASARFSSAGLSCFAACTDYASEMQFGALTIALADGTIFVSFRGTDESMVGWKEDFNLSFLDAIPSQLAAVEYLDTVAGRYPRRPIRVGGHSKGGHLAVYAAVHCRKAVQRRILQVYNNDGPGFTAAFFTLPGYERIRERISTFVPESSVVGMLMEHEEEYQVIRSTESGLWQHISFSWEVLGPSFVRAAEGAPEKKLYNRALRAWLLAMTPEQRREFIEAIYNLLTDSNIHQLQDLWFERARSVIAMAKTFGTMDKETRRALLDMLELLARKSVKVIRSELNIRERLESLRER